MDAMIDADACLQLVIVKTWILLRVCPNAIKNPATYIGMYNMRTSV